MIQYLLSNIGDIGVCIYSVFSSWMIINIVSEEFRTLRLTRDIGDNLID